MSTGLFTGTKETFGDGSPEALATAIVTLQMLPFVSASISIVQLIMNMLQIDERAFDAGVASNHGSSVTFGPSVTAECAAPAGALAIQCRAHTLSSPSLPLRRHGNQHWVAFPLVVHALSRGAAACTRGPA